MAGYAVLLLLIALQGSLAALPKGWKACSKSAPSFDSCMKKEIANAVTTLIDGDKRLGVLPLDPLKLDLVRIPRSKGPVSLDLSFHRNSVLGIKEMDIRSLKNDWKTLKATVHVPDLIIVGDYKVDGQVLVLPIKGEGKFNITADELDLDVDIDWKRTKMGGKEVFQMEKFYLDFKPKKAYLRFENLFNGDKKLGDQMNKFLNENWKVILDELRPALADGISQVFTQISNKIMSKIPVQEVDIK